MEAVYHLDALHGIQHCSTADVKGQHKTIVLRNLKEAPFTSQGSPERESSLTELCPLVQ